MNCLLWAALSLAPLSGCMAELTEGPGPGAESKDGERLVPGDRPDTAPLKIGEVREVDITGSVARGEVRDVTVALPGATFVKPHLALLVLQAGDALEVVGADGAVVETLFHGGEDIWVARVPGERTLLRLVAGDAEGERTVVVDRVVEGSVDLEALAPQPPTTGRTTRTICGDDDKLPARCYSGGMYAASQAVGHMIFSKNGSSYFCSGALISANNHFITNNHCISSQADADTVEIRFNYESTNCAGSGLANVKVVHGATFLKTSSALDYTLIQLRDNVSSTYGWLDILPDDVDLGAEVYIPQHAGGRRKEIAGEDDELGGPCRIRSVNRNVGGFAWGANLGYTCDTEQGSSGSPVILAGTNQMIALHHLGGCNNIGTYMRNIHPEIQAFLSQPPPPLPQPVSTEAPTEGWLDESGATGPAPIPDHDSTGITSTVYVPTNLMVGRIEVELDIVHPFRGDLVVTLSTPMGHRIVLADRNGGNANDLTGSFDITDKLPQDLYTAGPWSLNVRDEAKNDSGSLRGWRLRINDEPITMGAFDGTVSPAAPVPDNSASGLTSSIDVPDGVKASSVRIQLSVAHTWRGDLEITLTSPSGKTVPVWARTDASDSDDDVVGVFEVDGLDGDASGRWTLRVADYAPLDTGSLNFWRLGLNTEL